MLSQLWRLILQTFFVLPSWLLFLFLVYYNIKQIKHKSKYKNKHKTSYRHAKQNNHAKPNTNNEKRMERKIQQQHTN